MSRAVTHALRVLLTFYFSGASFLQRCENTKPEPLRLYRFPTLCVTMSRGTGAEGRGGCFDWLSPADGAITQQSARSQTLTTEALLLLPL